MKEHVGILSGHRSREHTFVGPDKIFGGNGIAVGPFCVGIEMESVGQAIFRNVPRLGDARGDIEVGIFGNESLHQGFDQAMFDDASDHLRVQVLRLGPIAEFENL